MKILPLLPNQENQPDPRFYAAAVSPGVKEEEVEVGMAAAADSQHASFLFEILNNNNIERNSSYGVTSERNVFNTREPTDIDRPALLGGALPITLVKQALIIVY